MSENSAKELNSGQGANRYKYQSFNARVSNLKLKITRQVGIKDESVENGSYFNTALESWKELNLSAPFVRFGLEARHYCQTLPQLLYHKDKVVDLLVEHLNEANPLSLEPILDLTVQLARDLDTELFPHVDRLLAAAIPLVKLRDEKVIEWTFTCIASLFKIYSGLLRKDLRPTFTLFAPYLGEDISVRYVIRDFVAEAYAYLMRKTSQEHLRILISHMLTALRESPTTHFAEGIANLFFETIKLVGTQFQHRGIDVVLKEILRALKNEDVQPDELAQNIVFQMVSKLTVRMVHYSDKDNFKPVVDLFLNELTSSLEATSKKAEKKWTHVTELLALINICVSVRKGTRIQDFVKLYEKAIEVSKKTLSTDSQAPSAAIQEMMNLSSALLAFSPLESVLFPGGLLLDSIFKHDDVSTVLAFSVSLIKLKWTHYTQILLPHLVKYCAAHWNKTNAPLVLAFLATLFTSDILVFAPGAVSAIVDENGLLRFPGAAPAANGTKTKKGTKAAAASSSESNERIVDGVLRLLSQDCDWKDEAHKLSMVSLEDEAVPDLHIPLVTAALSVVPSIALNWNAASEALLKLIKSLLGVLSKEDQSITLQKKPFIQGSAMATLHILLGEAIEVLAIVCERAGAAGAKTLADLWDIIINDALVNYGSNEVVLRAVAKYCLVLKQSNKHNDLFKSDTLRELYPKLEKNINSLQHRRRLHTLQILSSFEMIKYIDSNPQDKNLPQNDVLHQCLLIEESPVTIDSYREKTMHIRRLTTMMGSGRVNEFYKQVPIRLALGILTINFQPLWADATALLVRMAELYPDTFWELLHGELRRFEDETLLIDSGLSQQVVAEYRGVLEELSPDAPPPADLKSKPSKVFDCPTYTRVRRSNNAANHLMNKKNQGWSLVVHFIDAYAPGSDRLDYWNYYGLILKALAEAPSIAEQHNRQLVQIFLKFIKEEYEPAWNRKDEIGEDEEAEGDEGEDAAEKLKILPKTTKDTRNRLHLFLTLFSKFKNPKQTYESSTMFDLYLRMLTIGDAPLQKLALSCISTFKIAALSPYQENLQNLLDEVKFRDELSTFVIADGDSSSIGNLHREEVMPIILRLLYGCMISRKGKSSSKVGMSARRRAVLTTLGGCKTEELGFFITLMLSPFDFKGAAVEGGLFSFGKSSDADMEVDGSSPWIGHLKKQIGFLNILDDTIKQLGSLIRPFLPEIMTAVMCMIHQAQERLDAEIGNQEDLGGEEGLIETLQTKQLREVRQLGIKRLTNLFLLPIKDFDFEAYVPAMFTSFLNRRVPRLDTESTQAPSAIMELFAAWASRKEYVIYLVKYNDQVLPKLYSCLAAKKVRDSVVGKILEVCEDILSHCFEEKELAKKPLTDKVLVPYTDILLDNLEVVLVKSSSDSAVKFGKDNFTKRQISILSQIAAYVKNGQQAVKLVDLLLPSLKKSPRVVPERTKADILRIIVDFMPIIPNLTIGSPLFVKYYNHLAVLYSNLMARECRIILVEMMEAFARIDPHLTKVATLIADLNSFSTTRIDMPDFDRRMDAFNLLTNSLYKELDDRQWLPVLHNMMFYIRDPEEMSIRSNSSFAMTRFIDQCAETEEDSERREKFMGLLAHVIYPGLKKGFKSPIELVRYEFVTVLAHAVKKCPQQVQFSDMTELLAGGDEEASFFTNIYHIQLHRRIRALSRFSEICSRGVFRPSTLTHLFAPLIAHFIFEAEKSTDHNLVNETVSTLGVIASQLPWGAYYNLLKGYLKLIPRKAEMERILVRTVIAILDNFHFDIKNVEVSPEDAIAVIQHHQRKSRVAGKSKGGRKGHDDKPDEIGSSKAKDEDEDVEMEEAPLPESVKPKAAQTEDEAGQEEAEEEASEDKEAGEEEDEEEAEDEDVAMDEAESAAALAARIHDTVIKKLLPELHRYLTNKDEASVMIRVPVALAITKLLKALPDVSLKTNLPGLLTSVCQILKSRQQEARDTTRETLVKITMFLGASYFSFILKEMRGALLRGYQLHVLGFTLHALLTHLVPTLEVGELDYCLGEIVEVLMNDIFGETGIEKETEEITGKMKEAKSNLSFHSFELLAGVIEFKHMGLIMVPIKEVLSETEVVKVVRKVDEVLRRLATGLNNNPRFDTQDVLIFCHGLISQNLALSRSKEEVKKERSRQEINFTVNLKRPGAVTMDCFPANAHRFVAFGLNIFRAALNRNKFDVRDAQQLRMLDPFVQVVGNGTFSKYPDVIGLSLKIMCILAKLKLPSLESGMPVVIKQTFAIVKAQGSTKSELSQNCFRMLAVAIRECKSVEIKDAQLTMLLSMIQPDLEEPERQSTTFSLIRAIVSRKFVVPEMYDLMLQISEIMVTSQSQQARELCRNALLQFLLDYPQGRGRLRNQMNFLVKNLSYVFESGRQSVMEMMHAIIQKFADEILMDYAEMFFLALVMQLVNDDSSKCREMAGALIKALLLRMNRQKLDNAYLLLGKWFDQKEQRNLQRAAAQVFGLAIDAFGATFKKQIPALVPRLRLALESSLEIMEEARQLAAQQDQFEDDGQDAMDLDTDWEVGYYALNTFTKLVKQFPTVINSTEVSVLWPLISEHMLHPHAWVRLSATRLFGVFFSGINPETRQAQNAPQTAALLTPEMLKGIAHKLCEQLKSEFLSTDLGGQIVKNLFFIAKCYYALPMDYKFKGQEGEAEDPEEEEEEDEEDEEGEDEEKDEEDESGSDEEGTEATAANGSSSDSKKVPVNRSLFWLVKKLSFLSRGSAMKNNKNTVQQTFIFQAMAAFTTLIKPEELTPYLVPIISPIYRIVNDETAKGPEVEELKRLGQEVMDLVQKRAGTSEYLTAYNKVRQHVLQVRRERRQKRVMQALNDPEARARRRLQRNEMKSRKRQAKTKAFAKDKIRLTTIKKRRLE
ncbi:U3 snoRNP protein [Actinomortierella wolfii]|nr:U3 snoRNP protein [Actinomortierella wolfii]